MAELFEFRMPVWEIVLGGTAFYWFLLLIFRFVMRCHRTAHRGVGRHTTRLHLLHWRTVALTGSRLAR